MRVVLIIVLLLASHAWSAEPLIRVSISPEARVKAAAGGAARELRQGEWVEFSVEIENAAGITAPLVVESGQTLTQPGPGRWLRAELDPAGPLTGQAVEKRSLRLWSRDAGVRSAVLNFNAGQGTQDLGFRSDVLLSFKVAPMPEALFIERRAHAGRTFERFMTLIMNAPSEAQGEMISVCIDAHRQWFAQEKPDMSSALDIAERMRALDHAAPVRQRETAEVRGRVLDKETGLPTPARVWVKGSDGIFRHAREFADNATLSNKPVLPLLFAGVGVSYALPFFYCDGSFTVDVPAGRTEVILERGFEHPLVSAVVDAQPGEPREVTLQSRRFLDMKKLGWVSGDTHIHWAKNHWSEDEDIALLRLVQRAEDLRVANNLTLKHHTGPQNFTAPAQFPMGPIPGLCDAEYHAQMAEEYRNEEFYGHIILLNIKRLIEPISTGSMGGPPGFWDWPPNTHAIREARAQGGISIEAHGLGANNDAPVNVAQGLSDSIDQLEPEDYYRFLDCGFHLPISNGSDHPARVAGCCRVYVKTELPFSYQRWCDGLKAGRTFTTSGPLLFLSVNGKDIGDVLDVAPGTPLKIIARAVGRHPLGVLQIISNGQLLVEKPTRDREALIELEIPADEPCWLVARASQTASFNALDGPHIGHTSAIYVNVNGQPRFLDEAAGEWIRRMEIHAADMEKRGRFQKPEQRAEAVGHVRSGIEVFRQLEEKYRKTE